MRLQIGDVSFNSDEIRSPRLNTNNIRGLTDLNVSIELAYGTTLPSMPALVGLVLSEDTATPVKVFSGWVEEYEAQPIENGTVLVFSPKILSILHYINDGKPIANYLGGSNTLLGHAENLATDAGRLFGTGSNYFQLSVSPSDTDPFIFVVENRIEPLLQVLSRLAENRKYDLIVQDAGWLDIPTLYSSNGTITNLIFKEKGSSANPAPSPLNDLIYDPTSPDYCDFPLLKFKWGKRKKSTTTIEVQGVGAENAKEVGQTLQTSYLKTVIKPVPNPVENTGLEPVEYSIELPLGAIEVHQFLIVTAGGDIIAQLAQIEPYDSQTPLEAGKFYFDRAARRVIPNNIDIANLDFSLKPSFAITVTFRFLKYRETDTNASDRLSTATNGAISQSYLVVNDQSISDFGTAQTIAQNALESETAEEFYCTGEFHSTTVIPRNGQTFRIRIPAYNEDHIVTINTVSTNFPGKIEEGNSLRDEMIHDILASVDISSNLVGSARSVGVGGFAGSGNSPLPVYDEIPFGASETGCRVGLVAVTGTHNFNDNGTNLPLTISLGGDVVTVTREWVISSPDVNAVLSFATYRVSGTGTAEVNVLINGTNVFTQSSSGNNLDLTEDPIHDIDLSTYTGDVTVRLEVSVLSGDLFYLSYAGVSCCLIDSVLGGFGITGTETVFDDGFFPNDARHFAVHDISGLTVDQNNNFYVAGYETSSLVDSVIRKVDTDNMLSLFAGKGATFPAIDGGDPLDYEFHYVGGLAYYDNEIIFIDSFPNYIWAIDLTTGLLRLIYDENNNASTSFYSGLCVDSEGNLFIADNGRSVIWTIPVTGGTPTIYAGTLDSFGYSGDGGQATDAEINISNIPTAIACDSEGNLYICQPADNLVRKVTKTTGVITTIAGSDTATLSGDGRPATDTFFSTPNGIAVKNNGEIHIADTGFSVIRKILADGTVKSIVGGILEQDDPDDNLQTGAGYFRYGGDRHAATIGYLASNNNYMPLVFDQDNELLIGDDNNGKIRKVFCTSNLPCKYTVDPIDTSIGSGGGSGSFDLITSDPNCAWEVSTSDAFITITSPTSGTGTATITFDVAAAGEDGRQGKIYVNQSNYGHTIDQSGTGGGGGN